MTRSPLKWLGGKIDIKVQVATSINPEGGAVWNVSNWGEAFWSNVDLEFQDISSYVLNVSIDRGQDKWDSRFGAGVATVELDNTTGIFAFDSGNALWNVPFRPGREIRIIAIPDPDEPNEFVSLFTGRMDSANDVFGSAGADIVTVVTAIDALGDLHANNPLAQTTATGVQDTHERVHAALDIAEWPAELRLIQSGAHDVQSSFLAQTTLEEVQRAAEAEGGALFADADNNIVFKSRNWLLGGEALMGDYTAATLLKEPVAYWRFDGATATADETGNGHTLTYSGTPTKQVDGVNFLSDDDAVEFDGTDDFATVANEAALELEQDMSIELWFWPSDLNGSNQALISCRASGDPLYELFYNPDDNKIVFFPSSSAGLGRPSASVFPARRWYHVVVTIEWVDSDRLLRFYKDGQLIHSSTVAYQPSPTNPVLNIGRRAIANDLHFDGDISELVIYDKVLTATEVAHQYNSLNTSLNDRSIEVQGYLGYEQPYTVTEFEDDFTGTVINTAKWVAVQDATQDGVIEIPGPGTDYVTSRVLDIGNKWTAVVEFVDAGFNVQPEGGAYKYTQFVVAGAQFETYGDADDWPGTLTAYVWNGVEWVELDSDLYDETAHRWLKIEANENNVTFSTAPAEAGPWTVFDTSDALFYHYFTKICWLESDGNATYSTQAEFDNLTITYQPVTADIIDVTTSHETARIRNDVSFARAGGTVQTAFDGDSKALFGKRSHQRLDYINNDDADVLFLAERYLAAYKDNRLRVDSVTIAANDDPDNEDLNRLFYASEFGDKISVKIRTLHDWFIEKETHIIGVSHSITPDDWIVTFTLDDAALAIAEES